MRRAKLAGFVRDNVIDGLRLDRGEEFLPSTADDVWADGRNGREVHNEYPRLQAELHRSALADVRGDDTVLWSRPGWTGTQAFAVFGGGDYPGSTIFGNGPGTDLGLRAAIIAQQRAAFMGYPIWGSDGGGNYEFKQRDVFARWIEYAAFSGIMVIGGTGDHAPWRMPTEPSHDDEMIGIYRRYTRLRERMLPYLTAAAREAGASGAPIVRPMPFLDRDDPRLGDRWDQYGFGPDLMVAPVWRNGERARSVYFPAGSWRSLWDERQRFSGPATVLVEAPLDTIPVFIRGDAATPFRAND
ncbi:MAG: glycoside hydrolase family 31 protein [bacterium]